MFAIKPLLTPLHKKLRFEWALKNINNFKDEWDSMIWSNKSRLKLLGGDEKNLVWGRNGERLNEKCFTKTVKFEGASIMFWGCISGKGKGKLVLVKGNLNSEGYISLLTNNLNESVEISG